MDHNYPEPTETASLARVSETAKPAGTVSPEAVGQVRGRLSLAFRAPPAGDDRGDGRRDGGARFGDLSFRRATRLLERARRVRPHGTIHVRAYGGVDAISGPLRVRRPGNDGHDAPPNVGARAPGGVGCGGPRARATDHSLMMLSHVAMIGGWSPSWSTAGTATPKGHADSSTRRGSKRSTPLGPKTLGMVLSPFHEQVC